MPLKIKVSKKAYDKVKKKSKVKKLDIKVKKPAKKPEKKKKIKFKFKKAKKKVAPAPVVKAKKPAKKPLSPRTIKLQEQGRIIEADKKYGGFKPDHPYAGHEAVANWLYSLPENDPRRADTRATGIWFVTRQWEMYQAWKSAPPKVKIENEATLRIELKKVQEGYSNISDHIYGLRQRFKHTVNPLKYQKREYREQMIQWQGYRKKNKAEQEELKKKIRKLRSERKTKERRAAKERHRLRKAQKSGKVGIMPPYIGVPPPQVGNYLLDIAMANGAVGGV